VATGLTNIFAETSLALQQSRIDRQLGAVIARLRRQFRSSEASRGSRGGAASAVAAESAERLVELETLRSRNSASTLSLVQAATVPTEPIGAPPWLVIFAALVIGLFLGALAAVFFEALRPRARRSEPSSALRAAGGGAAQPERR
jgi:hypothetical protein